MADDPNLYNPYVKTSDRKRINKAGLLPVWKARALQYWYEKDPLKTYHSENVNKFHWSWSDLIQDPVATVIGREILSEDEIKATLTWRQQHEAGIGVKKTSDYMRLHSADDIKDIPSPGILQFEKQMIHTRTEHSQCIRYCEIEGEKLWDRRQIYDWQYFFHQISGGLVRWDPHNMKSNSPGTMVGKGDGQVRVEKPLRGPNIRGRYQRDLRGEHDTLYEITNANDFSNLGSDKGGADVQAWSLRKPAELAQDVDPDKVIEAITAETLHVHRLRPWYTRYLGISPKY